MAPEKDTSTIVLRKVPASYVDRISRLEIAPPLTPELLQKLREQTDSSDIHAKCLRKQIREQIDSSDSSTQEEEARVALEALQLQGKDVSQLFVFTH